MSQIKIACICPIPNDPTSFYRGLGPLARLAQSNEKISLMFPQTVDWASLSIADIVFLQRPALPEHFAVLCLAKDLGLPVWVDFDDDNLAVPKDNPSYVQYNQLPIKDAIIKLARHCDVLTVSTKFLQRKYGIYNKNTVLVPNALDDKLMHLRQIPPGPRNKRFLWRGTPSHQRNLMSVGKELISLSKKYEDHKFTFFGCDPIDLTDLIKNNEVVPPSDITNYFKILCSLHAKALYYPLGSTDHAQARSHISWLEGTFAGCVVLASKNDEFSRPGLLNFATPAEFEAQADLILNGSIDIEKHIEESWAHIQENYMLSKVNPMRMNIIESVLCKA